jgi:hypothetical protein
MSALTVIEGGHGAQPEPEPVDTSLPAPTGLALLYQVCDEIGRRHRRIEPPELTVLEGGDGE